MNRKLIIGILTLSVLCGVAFAAPANLKAPNDDAKLLIKSMRSSKGFAGTGNGGSARFTETDGDLRSLSAPGGHYFSVGKKVSGDLSATAGNFIKEHGRAFGVRSNAVDFIVKKSKKKNGRNYERFQQRYSGISVYGGEMIIQLNDDGDVEYAFGDIMRNTDLLDGGSVSTVPTITGDEAGVFAVAQISEEHPDVELEYTEPELMIYDPEVIGNAGDVRLVWKTEVFSVSMVMVREFVLVDAHTGDIALHFTLIMDARNREVYDSDSSDADPGTLARSEGEPPVGIVDVDDVYDFLGDTYDFYLSEHGRDSIDGAGVTLSATVRFCPDPDFCPFINAFWDGSRMYFGEGLTTDDITGHELTHGVTQLESNLIYQNESGAISESFSDMWGEWIDQVNGAGNDSTGVKWLMGEDSVIGAIRDMADPTQLGDPDRKCSPNWYDGAGDNGGVHTNSGVGNKLCYLLTDGDIFQNVEITGMGISRTAELMYEAQTSLLTSGSDYADLHISLTQAAINLGWTDGERFNLEKACLVTELSKCFDPADIQDTIPPVPDPMVWAVKPVAVGVKTIYMEASVATEDFHDVEYMFGCDATDDTDPNALVKYSSDWQSSTVYTRGDFSMGKTYTFHVKARDLSENLNETQWSSQASVTTASPTDDLPPFPNPAQWLVKPKLIGHYDDSTPEALNRVRMSAKIAIEESTPVEYSFVCTRVVDGSSVDQPIDPLLHSGWQTSYVHQLNRAWNSTYSYTFTVTARDALGNETTASTQETFSVNATGNALFVVPVPYATIQAAIDATQKTGDVVVVRPGNYSGLGNRDLDFNSTRPGNPIDIVVRSINPDNPAVVASTIINCGGLPTGLPQDSHRGFLFQNGETANSLLSGFTITQGYISVDGALVITPGTVGNNGIASMGGGISCTTGSSPTITKCVITNCVAEGGWGSAGTDGDPTAIAGGNGGNGAMATGGAIYCDPTSRPTITNVTIDNCHALGGQAANGGRGADADGAGPTAAGAGGNGGTAGLAFGGGIFIDAANPGVTISKSSITNCSAIARSGANGGDGGDDTINAPPVPGAPGAAGSSLNAVGGGIACDIGGNATIIDCTIDRNQVVHDVRGVGGSTGLPAGPNPVGLPGQDSVAYGGGLWYDSGCGNVVIQGTAGQRTTISNNTSDHHGGGIYVNSATGSSTSPTLTNCDITGNTALMGDGGGIWYADGGTVTISNCLIDQNTATSNSNNDSKGGGIRAGVISIAIPTPASPTSTVVVQNGSVFSGNLADAGGGIYAEDTNLSVLSRSKLNANTALGGAGLRIEGSLSILTVTDSMVMSNSASLSSYGWGGAMVLHGINGFVMTDSIISDNDSSGYGGALYMEGFNSAPYNITNCLITDNTTSFEGGAISCNFGAWLQMYNCTIAGNAAQAETGIGGGIHCSEDFAWVEVFDSIIWNNTADQGSQLAAGRVDGSLPGFEWADIDINYCDVKGGLSDVFQELPPAYPFGMAAVWFMGSGNIDLDPAFVFGYFLRHADLQGFDSPCIDAGDPASTLLISDPNYTTRTDFGPDTDRVDMGYHYDATGNIPQVTLTVEVVNVEGGWVEMVWPGGGLGTEPGGAGTYQINQGLTVGLHAVLSDPASGLFIIGEWQGTDDDTITDPNNTVTMVADKTVRLIFDVSNDYAVLRTSVITDNGTIDASTEGLFTQYPGYSIYYRGTVVTLTAVPDNLTDRVRWTGTDYDYNQSYTGTVTLDVSKDVQARFFQSDTLFVGPSGEGVYTSIQLAIEAANEDDIIMVMPGTYNIYESGQPPESTRIVLNNKRITLQSMNTQDPSATRIIGGFAILNVGRDTVINGFTITGNYGGGVFTTPDGSGVDGIPGRGVSGGGMRLHSYGNNDPHENTPNASSPTVLNCIFENCAVFGMDGGPGNDGISDDGTGGAIIGEPGHGGWAGWAHGGAVSVGTGASPIFVNCQFTGNIAVPGDGGNAGNDSEFYGGHGGNWGNPLGGPGYTWEQGPFEDYWFYTGAGGAVYCANDSTPEFVDCTFTNNTAFGGSCGLSGTLIINFGWPYSHYRIDRFGGAVYGARGSKPTFDNCVFSNNQADTEGPALHNDGQPAVSDDINISFGGAVAFEDASNPVFTDCTFTNNEAVMGGAGYITLAGFNVADSNFINNTALNAGALAIIESTANIEHSNFTGNTATAPGARGGAVFSFDSDIDIRNSEFEDNATTGSGGGIYTSGYGIAYINNCLINSNLAEVDGGGIASNWYAETNIKNCTVVNNIANGLLSGRGGGLSSSDFSHAIITDSIFWDNTAISGPQISVGFEGSESGAITVSYSDIQGGQESIDLANISSILNWDAGNINFDPMFIAGYKLSQTSAGQLPEEQSPCVDTGSTTAVIAELDMLTTRTDSVIDTDIVDMGYHYDLFAETVDTPSVTITVPGANPYDPTKAITTIQDAIAAARSGDVIQLKPGIYQGGGLIVAKDITIQSDNPDDPDIVALTVIDVGGYANRGITFLGVGPGAVLNGVTIANGGFGGITVDDGADPGDPGGDGGWVVGGGIAIAGAGSSPTIRNSVIRDCDIFGHHGGNGVATDEETGGRSGRGGWGGAARGGGVYIGEATSPTFINTTITNNTVTGGNGGNGADYVAVDGAPDLPAGFGGLYNNEAFPDSSYLNLGLSADRVLPYRYYSGYGGGVYCDTGSSPTFIDCVITDNRTRGGMSGLGGAREFSPIEQPVISYELPSYGGGVYCADGTNVLFRGCTISGNVAPKPTGTRDPVTGDVTEVIYHLSPYLGYGGGIAAENTASLVFEDCTIEGNESSSGGGVYFSDADPLIIQTVITNNTAYLGGGVYGNYGTATVEESHIALNYAGTIEGVDFDDVAGQGGGIYCGSVIADIVDCNVLGNEATASGGGIFMTGNDDMPPTIKNCLIAFNRSGRDGAGISVNWYSEPVISFCTLYQNFVTGSFGSQGGSPYTTSVGGGLYVSYSSNVVAQNNIFWANTAEYGRQIALHGGFEEDPNVLEPAALLLGYNDVQLGNDSLAIDVDTGLQVSYLGAGFGFYDTNINEDPLFVSGPLGDFYLQNSATSSTPIITSPCVDAGSAPAVSLGMNSYTTRVDGVMDAGIVDMGFHYAAVTPEDQCSSIDIDPDGRIDIGDFALFATYYWVIDACGDLNDWCQGADVNVDTNVNEADYLFFVGCWLASDTQPPMPDPPVWKSEPNVINTTTIDMTAGKAIDNWWGQSVQYYFEVTYNGGAPEVGRDWDSNPNFTDIALDPLGTYSYKYKVRDFTTYDGQTGLETAYSTEITISMGDHDEPTPNPSQWLIEPFATGSTSISMTAVTATDASGPVEYQFDCITDGSKSRLFGDIDAESSAYEATGLLPETQYTFRVWAKDALNNITNPSVNASATTSAAPTVDLQAPLPNPADWDVDDGSGISGHPIQFDFGGGDIRHYMRALIGSDATTGASDPVEYQFKNETTGAVSGWHTEAEVYGPYGVSGREWMIDAPVSTVYNYTVQIRDSAVPPNEGAKSAPFPVRLP